MQQVAVVNNAQRLAHVVVGKDDADAFGFESLFMHTWRIREKVLDIIEETTGGRVIFGSCKVGGVRRDIDNDTLAGILKRLDNLAIEIKEAAGVFLKDSSVKHRLVDVGVLSKDEAYKLGAVGPVLRACGISLDTRKIGYAAYKDIAFEPVTETQGDSYSRCVVRIKELFQSIDIIHQAAAKIPPGAIEIKVSGAPDGEFFARTE